MKSLTEPRSLKSLRRRADRGWPPAGRGMASGLSLSQDARYRGTSEIADRSYVGCVHQGAYCGHVITIIVRPSCVAASGFPHPKQRPNDECSTKPFSQHLPTWGENCFPALASRSADPSTNIEYGVGLWIRKGSDYPQSTGGLAIHPWRADMIQDRSTVGGGFWGPGRALCMLSHGRDSHTDAQGFV